jgi:hypothetical protein
MKWYMRQNIHQERHIQDLGQQESAEKGGVFGNLRQLSLRLVYLFNFHVLIFFSVFFASADGNGGRPLFGGVGNFGSWHVLCAVQFNGCSSWRPRVDAGL